ncbi:Peroxisomal membrane protein PEX14 [Porphyridium purpureum]|uniref:Peroxisomal membrane protein PEX14 n=1 Tax=Porphyridium purpureum TaxID=35688 RepID=A0A5J4Z722_PORPP|nr:Peroxisomal membrane protein PEX14 [Porphyridium purpureum]|eukprot:POR5724..scf295_1
MFARLESWIGATKSLGRCVAAQSQATETMEAAKGAGDKMEVREDQVAMAVSFLNDARVKEAPAARCVAFLKRKALNDSEIREAFKRVGREYPEEAEVERSETQMKQSAAVAAAAAANPPHSAPVMPYAQQPALMIPQGAQLRLEYPGEAQRQLAVATNSRTKNWMIGVLSAGSAVGALMVLRELLRKYVVPLYFPEESSAPAARAEQEKATELRELKATLNELAKTTKRQQEYIEHVERSVTQAHFADLKSALQMLNTNVEKLAAGGSSAASGVEATRVCELEAQVKELSKWVKPIGSSSFDEPKEKTKFTSSFPYAGKDAPAREPLDDFMSIAPAPLPKVGPHVQQNDGLAATAATPPNLATESQVRNSPVEEVVASNPSVPTEQPVRASAPVETPSPPILSPGTGSTGVAEPRAASDLKGKAPKVPHASTGGSASVQVAPPGVASNSSPTATSSVGLRTSDDGSEVASKPETTNESSRDGMEKSPAGSPSGPPLPPLPAPAPVDPVSGMINGEATTGLPMRATLEDGASSGTPSLRTSSTSGEVPPSRGSITRPGAKAAFQKAMLAEARSMGQKAPPPPAFQLD